MFFRTMRNLGLVVFMALLFLPLSSGPAKVDAADCRYVLGFQAIHDGIPDIVGDCLVNEHYSANGDALQETTKGLLVWRKADNNTAFTDGYRTWVNGPLGIQQRLNTERFDWETPINANCRYVLGFKTLHDGIPDIVGDCQVNEHYSANGDALQETTKGLLVWRKSDNNTAFTDGYRTWVNGPFGIQQRFNTERFDWETPIAQPTPTPSPSPTPVPQVQSQSTPYPGLSYGMQVDQGTNLPRALQMLRAAGFTWAKVQIRWDIVESSKGNINWGYLDGIINQMSANGTKLLFSFTAAPRWSTPSNYTDPGPPSNPQDLANFVGAIAAHYPGRVHAYEIWNEQNVFFEWGGRGRRLNAAQYVDLLKASYIAVKSADPTAVVVSGGLTPTGFNDGDTAYDDVVYMEMMYQAGVQNWCDAIGVHGNVVMPYAANLPASANGDHGSFYFRRFEQLRDIMEKYGDSGKQMWFTEFGWPSSSEGIQNFPHATQISEAQQATWLVQAYQYAKSTSYVGVMLLWNLNFAPSAEANDALAKAAYSVLHRDWSTRPAYNALAAMPK